MDTPSFSHKPSTLTAPTPRQIQSTIKALTERLDEKQKEADAFASEHRLQTPNATSAAPTASAEGDGGAQGVLI